MITLDNLLDLLATHPDYEQAACFARDFGLVPDPDARVLRDDADVYLYEVPLTKGNAFDDVAQVAIWRKLGIVVAWRRTESHPGCLVDEQRNPLRVSCGPVMEAGRAEANLATSLVQEGSFALLRRPPDRNLPMLLVDGKWEVYDTSGDVNRNAIGCLKRLLWADVPPQKPPFIRLDLTRREVWLVRESLDLARRGLDERGGAEVDALNGKLLEILEPRTPRDEVVITKDDLLAGIAGRERETGQKVLTPEERVRSESYGLIFERYRRIAEAVGWDPALMPQVVKTLIDGMDLASSAAPIPVLDESAKGRPLCEVRACSHQSKHVCWLSIEPRRHIGEGACPISCDDFDVGPKAAPTPAKHPPTPWRVGTIDLSDEAGTSAAIFDANGILVLMSPEVVELGEPLPSADAAAAVHAADAVNRMARMDEAAKIQTIAEAARPLPRGAGYAALDLARALLSGDGDSVSAGGYRRALEIVIRSAHGATCETNIGKSCSCHVGVAERELMAADLGAKERAPEKPIEHVAVTRPPIKVNAETPTAKCTCPKTCDCQNPEPADGVAGKSNSCPVHNLNPDPDPNCPIHGEKTIGESRAVRIVRAIGGEPVDRGLYETITLGTEPHEDAAGMVRPSGTDLLCQEVVRQVLALPAEEQQRIREMLGTTNRYPACDVAVVAR